MDDSNNGRKNPVDVKLGKFGWLAYPLALSLPFLIMQFFLLSSFHQLPGPIYGGDIYWHYGEALGIALGKPPWENPQVSGEFAYYSWLTQFVIAQISKITGDLLHTYLYFALAQTVLAAIASFYMGLVFFRNKYAAALIMLLSVGVAYQPNIGGFGGLAFVPLFLAFFYKSFTEGRLRNKLLAGLFFGLASLSHVSFLPPLLALVAAAFLYAAVFRGWKMHFSEGMLHLAPARPGLRQILFAAKLLAPAVVIGIALSMLFWGPVLFIYKARVLNPVDVYTNADLSKFGLVIAYEMLTGTYFQIDGLFSLDFRGFLFSIAVLSGLYLAWKNRSQPREKLFLALAVISILVGLHYFITLPLFDRAAIPPRLYYVFAVPLSLLFFTLTLAFIWNSIKKPRLQKAFAAAVLAFVLIPAGMSIGNLGNDQWVNAGRQGNFAFSEIADWIKQNTQISDVFLSHQELAFAVNGLTARDVMLTRRTHFSPYIDIDRRLADAAVILYGNSTKMREELLKKYNVKYLYWDVNWLRFAAENEPILIFPHFDAYLEENGVAFRRVNYYLDPAYGMRYPRYNLLAIGPSRNDMLRPWSEQLDVHLQLVREFHIQGQLFAGIYKIDYGSF